jgi:gluconolactonase
MHPSLQIFDEAAHSLIHTNFDIETLSDDCQFTEGPVWHPEGFYIFSDITANTVYKLVPGQRKEALITNSGTTNIEDDLIKKEQAGANGLAWDHDGTLLVCRHASGMVARWNGKELEPLLTGYQSKRFNSPNDIIVDNRGRIFFSDPPYGLKEGQYNPEHCQPLAGVYCYDNGTVSLLCDKYSYPNGVCITPDGQELYICSNKPVEKFISVYNLQTLQFSRILAEENSDGIKCDPKGNVFLSNRDGILILNSQGKRLALISFNTIPANHCFGGPGKKDLFVTARQNIYLIKDLLK